MPKFKIIEIKNNYVYLNENDNMHIIKSLRSKKGDIILCFDKEFEYDCKIISINNLKIKIINRKKIINDVKNINIYLGVINKSNFEIALKKLNEINCKSITPVFFNRSQHNIILNNVRLKKIINESSKQCNRNIDIILNEAIYFKDLLKLLNNESINIVAYQNSNKNINFEITYDKDINLIIGPEGGFIKEEIDFLKKVATTIKLTNTILRSETASIYLASIISYELEKKNEKR